MRWCTCLSPIVPHELTETQAKHFVLFRIYEALREIGVLLIAFTPLDGAFAGSGSDEVRKLLLGFGLVGMLLFCYGVLGERRLHDGERRS